MKILALVLTTTASLAAAVVLFFFMLMGMNGFNESDASYGLMTYIVLAVFISILAGGGSYLIAAKLMAREIHPVGALLIAVPVLTTVAVALEFVSVIVGIMISEYVRTHR